MGDVEMNYLSVCSGIEAATVAWHHMGWKPVGFSEIEKFPSQVLAHHYPQVTNFGDMTKYKEWQIDGTIGLLVGGTPCQSFSVAGLRKGLSDPRGNLALTYVGILDHFRPKWFIWENVPGVLSSNQGRDFAAFLTALGIIGYGWSYRVLDAQYFGVAQRRKRVFVVGCLGDWKPAAEVLFESESLRRNTAKSRKTGKSVTGYVESSFGQYREDVVAGTTKASGGVLSGGSETFIVGALDTECGGQKLSHQSINSGHIFAIPIHAQATQFNGGGNGRNNDGKGNGLGIGKPGDPMNTLDTSSRHAVVYENHPSDSRVKEMGDVCQTVTSSWGTGGGNIPFVQNIAYEWHNQDSRIKPIDVAATLNCNAGGREGHLVQEVFRKSRRAQSADDFETWVNDGKANTINTFDVGDIRTTHAVAANMAVRRLTPVECERLQGFPDNYTNIRENCPDGARYKALGNSMAVPVMRWIGERINNYERL
jgi:DNA (cytosine-5)-methyltransferase 1